MSCLGHYAGHLRNFTSNMVNMVLPREFFINVYSQKFCILYLVNSMFINNHICFVFSFFLLLLNIMKFVLLIFKDNLFAVSQAVTFFSS